MEFLVVLALEGGDRAAAAVPYDEAQVVPLACGDGRGLQVEGVAALGDLESAGRGLLGAAASLRVRGRLAVALVAGRRRVLVDRSDALAHAVGGAEGGGQARGERGDLQSGMHVDLLCLSSLCRSRYPWGV